MEMKSTSESETRKSLPFGVGTASGIKTEIEPLVKRNLDFKNVKENPILRPIANINKSYENLEILINRALWEYSEDKEQIDEMIKINPKYSETIILSKFQNILSHVKQIIHAQDIQKDNMKDTLNEMIKIAEEEYGVLAENEFNKDDFGKDEKIIKKEISLEEIRETPDEEQKKEVFYSDLLEKSVPVPETPESKENIPELN